MNGQILYEQYVKSLFESQNCTTDSWADLPDEDKEVWNDLARWVGEQK